MLSVGLRICLGLILLGSLALYSGCDTKKAGSDRPPVKISFDPKKPCNLWTKEEVEAVMKKKIKEPETGDYFCTYTSVDHSTSTSLNIMITEETGSFNEAKESAQNSGWLLKQVEGIGEGAFFLDYDKEHKDQKLRFLEVHRKNYVFSINSTATDGHTLSDEALIILAKKAFEKLP
jgi:hypothetical protein